MIELTRTHDPVLLSLIKLRLAEADVAAFVFDAHTSNAYAGALDTVPSRVMIDESDLPKALPVLAEVLGMAERR